MATVFNSDQMAKVLGTPVKLVKPNEFGGRLRTLYFSCTLPGSGLATGDTITLGRIPPNARLIGGNIAWSATQGATATTAIGTSASSGAYMAAAVTASTAKFALIATQALGHGTVTAAETTVVATNAAAAWTAASVLTGNIDYVVD
jgi:hypothetical protein